MQGVCQTKVGVLVSQPHVNASVLRSGDNALSFEWLADARLIATLKSSRPWTEYLVDVNRVRAGMAVDCRSQSCRTRMPTRRTTTTCRYWLCVLGACCNGTGERDGGGV